MLSLPSSPLSSPSSSRSLGAIDSSPPSSPTLEPLTSSPISPGPAHPYAASTKVVKPLPLYEKRGTKRPRYRERWADQINSDVEIADVFIDETPPRRVSRATDAWNTDISSHARPLVDPLAASAKQEWIPPMREKKLKTHSRATSDASTVTDVFSASTISGGLQDAFVYRPPPVLKAPNHQSDPFSTDSLLQTSPAASRSRRTNMNTEHRRWDDAINSAIAEANGVVDLRQVEPSSPTASLTCVPQRLWCFGHCAHAHPIFDQGSCFTCTARVCGRFTGTSNYFRAIADIRA